MNYKVIRIIACVVIVISVFVSGFSSGIIIESAGIIRAPAGLTNRGCSYGLRIRAGQWDAARACLQRAELRPIGIYQREGDSYREVIV